MKRFVGMKALVASGLAFAALTVSACGSSDDKASTSSAGSSTTASADVPQEVLDRLERYSGEPQWVAPGERFDASKARGKTIFSIPISSDLPFIASIEKSQEKIAKELGVNYIGYPNQGAPDDWARGMDQAIAQKADLIILSALPNPANLQPQIKKAQAAGIPVISTHGPDPESYPEGTIPAGGVDNLTGYVPGRFVEVAQLEADWVIKDSGGKANVLILTGNDVLSARGHSTAVAEELDKNCPNCRHTTIDVPLSDWVTKIPTEVQTALTKDPTIDYVIPIYDAMADFVVSGATAAGRRDKIKISTFNATPSVLDTMAKGGPVKFNVGESSEWLAYVYMDRAFRMLAGEEVPLSLETPEARGALKLWTEDNLDEAGSPAELDKGYGDRYAAGFAELWGLPEPIGK